MYENLAEALLGSGLALTGLFPIVHVNTIIELLEKVEIADFSLLLAVPLVFGRIPFELIVNAKLGIGNEQQILTATRTNDKQFARNILLHCVVAMIVSLLLYPFYSLFAGFFEKLISPATAILLGGIFAWFLLTQQNKTNSLIIALLAGLTGIILLEKNLPNALFILLTGLYGVPTLLTNQEVKTHSEAKFFPLLVIIGAFIGMSSSFLPAMTPITLTVTALCFLNRNSGTEFVSLNAAVIGSRTVSDFAAMEFLAKGRSSATAKILESGIPVFSTNFLFIAIGIAVAVLFSFLALQAFQRIPSKISFYTKALILLFIGVYVFFTSQLIGVIALSVCGLVGLTCQAFETSKGCLGSCILLPSILYFV